MPWSFPSRYIVTENWSMLLLRLVYITTGGYAKSWINVNLLFVFCCLVKFEYLAFNVSNQMKLISFKCLVFAKYFTMRRKLYLCYTTFDKSSQKTLIFALGLLEYSVELSLKYILYWDIYMVQYLVCNIWTIIILIKLK